MRDFSPPPGWAEKNEATQLRFFQAALSSIPDYVYAFDTAGRFTYANAALLDRFAVRREALLGRTFAELGYPPELVSRLNAHLRHVFETGNTVEDEVYFRSPTGHAAHFSFRWGPVRNADNVIDFVIGVSRDTSQRHGMEERLRQSEARLRAATELVGVGIYSWDPVTGALQWDDRLRAMWGLEPGAAPDMDVFQSQIHPDDLAAVRQAIADCIDPSGDGIYSIEYRVRGQTDGKIRHIATMGKTNFAAGRATSFIGAAIDVTQQRKNEAAVRSSEAQFRGLADHSSNLIWIADPKTDAIIYRSAAYEQIWGQGREQGATLLPEWLKDVHAEDQDRVTKALETVKSGEVAKYDYRLVRPADGAIRRLHDTSFPIRDENGLVFQIGGITEDLTPDATTQVYVICSRGAEARKLAGLLRMESYKVRVFTSVESFLDIAPVLSPGCVLVDLRSKKRDGFRVPTELKAKLVPLPTIFLDEVGAGLQTAIAAMKAGAIDYLIWEDDASFRPAILRAIGDCPAVARSVPAEEIAHARLARLTPREREVLVGLVEGGTNKTIARTLEISPRTVELHRAQLMKSLDVASLTELLQIALAAGVASSSGQGKNH